MVKDTLLVSAPLMISAAQLDRIVGEFKAKFEKKRLKSELDQSHNLIDIARRLNEKYFENKLTVNSIEYVTDQNSKYGCCNFRDSRIRISHKVGLMPEWVRDYVIIHEMAHLIEPNHSGAFWEIVSRYRLAERARGYLMAAGLESEGD
jgi:predicted metal-dependent hydrolase